MSDPIGFVSHLRVKEGKFDDMSRLSNRIGSG
jgi:hypothetical protein